jgi:hypothetical protein
VLVGLAELETDQDVVPSSYRVTAANRLFTAVDAQVPSRWLVSNLRSWPMDLDALVAKFPRIWHATFLGGWDGIQRSGLRSSTDLLTDAGRSDEGSVMRSDPVHLHYAGGGVVLRNQVPNRKDPGPYLDGITVAEWWELLNSRSYFFADQVALDRLVDSYAKQGIGQEVITFQTRRLLSPVAEHIEVSTVNAGVFPRATGPSRGRSTFQPLSEFSGEAGKIKEITVTTTVPIEESAVMKVVRFTPGEDPVRIWP